MRWCFFSPGYQSLHVLAGDTRTSGGAEAQVAHLAVGLAQLGHEVGLVYGDGGRQAQLQVVSGIRCIDAVPSWRRPASLAAFWRAMDFLSPGLLYARLPSDFLWMMGLFARSRRRSQFVYALAHDLHCAPWNAYDYNRWFHAPLYALGLQMADVIAVQHEHQLALVSPRLRSRLARVPNVLRSISDSPRAYDQTTFDAIWVGQIRPEKQLERFLDLAAALPNLRFAVVGGFNPYLSPGLHATLEERLLGFKNLAYFGPQYAEGVMALMVQSRVLVNTSRAEGFPNTMLEAWSVGVPVVSLSVDPGAIIEREQLGLVSGTEARLKHDVSALARTESLNMQFGGRGLAYVRRTHSLEEACRALAKALPGAELVPVAVRLT
jgi:glycosyltransferase involved in cell wall biosynthesis